MTESHKIIGRLLQHLMLQHLETNTHLACKVSCNILSCNILPRPCTSATASSAQQTLPRTQQTMHVAPENAVVQHDTPAVLLWPGWRRLAFAAKLLLRLPAAAAAAAWATPAPWGLSSQTGTEEDCLHRWRVLRSSSSSRTSCTTGCKMGHIASRRLLSPLKGWIDQSCSLLSHIMRNTAELSGCSIAKHGKHSRAWQRTGYCVYQAALYHVDRLVCCIKPICCTGQLMGMV